MNPSRRQRTIPANACPTERTIILPETNVTVYLKEPERGREAAAAAAACDVGGASTNDSLLAFLLHTSTYQSSIDVVDGQSRRSRRPARSLTTFMVAAESRLLQKPFRPIYSTDCPSRRQTDRGYIDAVCRSSQRNRLLNTGSRRATICRRRSPTPTAPLAAVTNAEQGRSSSPTHGTATHRYPATYTILAGNVGHTPNTPQ